MNRDEPPVFLHRDFPDWSTTLTWIVILFPMFIFCIKAPLRLWIVILALLPQTKLQGRRFDFDPMPMWGFSGFTRFSPGSRKHMPESAFSTLNCPTCGIRDEFSYPAHTVPGICSGTTLTLPRIERIMTTNEKKSTLFASIIYGYVNWSLLCQWMTFANEWHLVLSFLMPRNKSVPADTGDSFHKRHHANANAFSLVK